MKTVAAEVVFGKTYNSRARTGAAGYAAYLVLNQRQVRRLVGFLLFFFHE